MKVPFLLEERRRCWLKMVYNVYFHPLVGEDSQFEQYVVQSFTYLRFKNTCLVHATDYIFSAHNVMLYPH